MQIDDRIVKQCNEVNQELKELSIGFVDEVEASNNNNSQTPQVEFDISLI